MNNVQTEHSVLIFEDDMELALDWKSELEKKGIAAEHFWNLGNAMARCNEKKFDVIISDIFIKDPMGNLKAEAGVTFVSRLRYGLKGAPEWGKTVPVIAVTGSLISFGFDVLQLAKINGETIGMRKPFKVSELVKKVELLLSEKETVNKNY